MRDLDPRDEAWWSRAVPGESESYKQDDLGYILELAAILEGLEL
jgi:hypothetical protein